jgi:uncharacterized surface protein with fasciclin (FAS1) repeats
LIDACQHSPYWFSVSTQSNPTTYPPFSQAAGLTDALTDPEADYTVFAPNNAAFEELLAALGQTPTALLAETEALQAILR